MPDLSELPMEFLLPIFYEAGVWYMQEIQAMDGFTIMCHMTTSCMSVCKPWREAIMGSNFCIATLMLKTRGHRSLVRVIESEDTSNYVVDICSLIREMQRSEVQTRDRRAPAYEVALMAAVSRGMEDVVRLLLGWEELDAPHADCCKGEALCLAAREGNEAMVLLLLGWPQHAPLADCQDWMALLLAAEGGHETVVKLLLEWPEHAPHATCRQCEAVVVAAKGGHEAVVKLLLGRLLRTPSVERKVRPAEVLASEGNHKEVMKLLREWRNQPAATMASL
jgi:Ankyrin repeats (3 copies)